MRHALHALSISVILCATGASATLGKTQRTPVPTGGYLVETQNTEDVSTLVDVRDLQPLQNGAFASHVYFITKKGEQRRSGVSYFADYMVKYDCADSTYRLMGGEYLDRKFKLITILTVPSEAKAWSAASDPKNAARWGYDELCKTAPSLQPIADGKKSWEEVAASYLPAASTQ